MEGAVKLEGDKIKSMTVTWLYVECGPSPRNQTNEAERCPAALAVLTIATSNLTIHLSGNKLKGSVLACKDCQIKFAALRTHYYNVYERSYVDSESLGCLVANVCRRLRYSDFRRTAMSEQRNAYCVAGRKNNGRQIHRDHDCSVVWEP